MAGGMYTAVVVIAVVLVAVALLSLMLSVRVVQEYERGVVFRRVEVKDVALPEAMKRSMSRQAEAERERRARIITADGELQASRKLAQAAATMAAETPPPPAPPPATPVIPSPTTPLMTEEPAPVS